MANLPLEEKANKLLILCGFLISIVLAACNVRSVQGPITGPNHVQVIRTISLEHVTDNAVVELRTRPGVTQRILLKTAKKPRASLILFAGGHGNLNIGRNGEIGWGRANFLIRSRELFVDKDFLVTVVDAPSDRKSNRGMLFGFRTSVEHARDIAVVVSYLRKRAPVPVWLVGTSRGSTSAANAAIRITQAGADGVVLTSSVTRRNDAGGNLLDMALEKIKIPALVVHHKDDECRDTPYGGVKDIMERLKNSSISERISFTGGDTPVSGPCRPKSQHGFYGIEEEVVHAISQWIKGHL